MRQEVKQEAWNFKKKPKTEAIIKHKVRSQALSWRGAFPEPFFVA